MTSIDVPSTRQQPGNVLDMSADLADVRFAVIDVETSGLSTRWDQVLQVAVVVVDATGTVFDSFASSMRPRYGLLSRVGPRHVHGISRWSLRDAPVPRDVLTELASRLEGAVVTGHNVSFDVAFLARAAQRAGVDLDLSPALCTLGLSRRLDPERQLRHRLTDLCERHGIEHARPHDALSDAEATAAVLPGLLDRAGVHDLATLRRLVGQP